MRYPRIMLMLALLLLVSCGRPAARAPQPVAASRVERIIVYDGKGEETIRSDDKRFPDLARRLLAIPPTLSLPAGCTFTEEQVSTMKRNQRAVELLFQTGQWVTLGVLIPREERGKLATDEQGFQMVEATGMLFVLSGEQQGHVLLPSGGTPPTWGCWAVGKGKEIDTSWIKTVEEALKK